MHEPTLASYCTSIHWCINDIRNGELTLPLFLSERFSQVLVCMVCVYALTHTAHSCVFIVSTIVNVQSVAGTVCDVRLQPCTPYVVQHNGASALTIVSKMVCSRSSTQEAKLPAHNLQNETSSNKHHVWL